MLPARATWRRGSTDGWVGYSAVLGKGREIAPLWVERWPYDYSEIWAKPASEQVCRVCACSGGQLAWHLAAAFPCRTSARQRRSSRPTTLWCRAPMQTARHSHTVARGQFHASQSVNQRWIDAARGQAAWLAFTPPHPLALQPTGTHARGAAAGADPPGLSSGTGACAGWRGRCGAEHRETFFHCRLRRRPK